MQQGNRFKQNSLRKNSYLEIKKKQKVDFSFALKSIDLEEDKFINFLSSDQNKLYSYLYEIYMLSLRDELLIDKYFTNKEYGNTNKIKNDRIKKFIYETNGIVLSDIELLDFVKYKHKEAKEFQLMVRYNQEKDIADVYLIDFYHLMIPTVNHQISQRNMDVTKYYERIKKKVGHKYDIAHLKSLM